ncbi:MAG: hypothetical protein JXR15_00820 [Shimia sp.]|uniref:hypothetical protein n=1 Tax=Shimia sp. TaxID=1954381 RepID=UPI003B8E1C49
MWILIIIACVAVVSAASYVAIQVTKSSKINDATLCRQTGAINTTAILLDLTDPLNATQQARLKTILADELHNTQRDTMITLGVVSEDESRWGARFAKCKPATGEYANSLYENPGLIAERYQEEFLNPVNETLAAMLTGEKENQSPIMEAMQSLIAETPEFTRVSGSKKLIVVSDMLQHSDTLSFYRRQGWDFFSENVGSHRLAGNLSAVDIEIYLIPRSGPKIPKRQFAEDFWVRYFDRQGARPPTSRSLGDL